MFTARGQRRQRGDEHLSGDVSRVVRRVERETVDDGWRQRGFDA
jgi:hypothetical protein